MALLAGAIGAALVSGAAAAQCVGDCDGNLAVEINNLIVGVNIALGAQPLSLCQAFDCAGNGTVPINCLVQAVNNALSGCPSVPTATATGVGPTAASTPAPTSTAMPAQPTPTATSAAGGVSCSFSDAGCTTTACSCGPAPGTDYHIGASGSATGPVGTEVRVNINALGGGVIDCGSWTRIFGNVVTGCDILGCCQRQAGQPETVQWSVFEVFDFPCFCPAAPDPGALVNNFVVQCQLRPGPVTEVFRTSTGCP